MPIHQGVHALPGLLLSKANSLGNLGDCHTYSFPFVTCNQVGPSLVKENVIFFASQTLKKRRYAASKSSLFFKALSSEPI